jgi:hypothetical protein
MARRVTVPVEIGDNIVQIYSLLKTVPEDEVTDAMLIKWFLDILDNRLNFLKDMRQISTIADKYKSFYTPHSQTEQEQQ